HFARKMRRRSRPAGSVTQLARPLPGERYQLPQVVGRDLGVGDDQNGRARHRRDRHKIVEWIERQVRVYVRIDRDVAELNESDRVTVRRGFRDRLRAKISAAARAIFNHDTLAQGLADIFGGDARGDVHESAGSRHDHETDGSRRIVLSQSFGRSAERRRRCDCRDDASITEPSHGHSPRQRSPPVQHVHSVAPQLLAADDGVTLNFDLRFGNGQGGDGDEGAAGEIVAEYFASDLGEAIAVGTSVMNTVICTMSLSLPPAFSSVALMSLKICRTCPSRSPASDLPESSTTASCPASHTILPPSVITACE